jgi:tetratricopeptide (TPR) repeat protein
LGGISLARTLWLQGYPAQAVDRALRTIEEAAKLGRIAFPRAALGFFGIPVGRRYAARQAPRGLVYVSRAETNSMGPNLTIARGIRAALAIQRGDAKEGVENLQRCLEKLHPETYELHTELHLALIQGFIAIGRFAEALRLADDSIARVEENGDFCYMPELLRLKGKALLAHRRAATTAESYYQRSLELSRRPGRGGVGIAHLDRSRGTQGRSRAAR